eukprot:9684354-Alexandrium_andersonii.AAC.1
MRPRHLSTNGRRAPRSQALGGLGQCSALLGGFGCSRPLAENARGRSSTTPAAVRHIDRAGHASAGCAGLRPRV